MTNIKEVMSISGQLKDLKRSGWIQRQVKGEESVAEHSYAVALLVLLYTPPELNKLRCFELAIAHDLQEIYAGDFTPDDGISLTDKHSVEALGIAKIATQLENIKLIELLNEFEEQQTQEAIFVKSLDKLEAVLQSKYWEDNGRTTSCGLFEEFFINGNKIAQDKNVKVLFDILKKV